MWFLEPLKGQSKIQRTMNRDTNYTFRVVAQRRLSDRENPNNHFSKDRQTMCDTDLWKRNKNQQRKGKIKEQRNKYHTFNLNNQYVKVGIFIR